MAFLREDFVSCSAVANVWEEELGGKLEEFTALIPMERESIQGNVTNEPSQRGNLICAQLLCFCEFSSSHSTKTPSLYIWLYVLLERV